MQLGRTGDDKVLGLYIEKSDELKEAFKDAYREVGVYSLELV